jgi:hypothetical protein
MFGYSTEEVIGNPSSFLLPDLRSDQVSAGDFSARRKNAERFVRWLSMSPPNYANARSVVERILRDGKDAITVIKGLRTLFKRSPPEKTFVNSLSHSR